MNEKIETLPDLNAMALFARVVEHGSFSEASRRSGVPVSTVSRKVSELERTLGLRLLERSTRALRTTEAGREYYESCRRGLEEFEDANANATHRRTEVSGTLRLAAPPSLSDILLVPLIQSFLQRHPKVSAKVLVTDRHLDMVEDEVDISLRAGRQAESSLIFRRLIRYQHILVSAPSYLASADRLDDPADLKNHRLLGFSKWFGDVSWKLSNGGVTRRVPLKPWLAINDYAGVIRAAVSGMGVAEMPSILCRRIRGYRIL